MTNSSHNSAVALLIIDMQKGDFTPRTPRYDAEGVVNRINQLAQKFRSLGFPVIFIQHDGTGSGNFEKNTWSWELLDELKRAETDLLVDKTANNVFYGSKLDALLKERSINRLIITGSATDFCVEATVQSALSKDFHITVVSDGHTTADRPELTAKQVIDHYNWVWSNLLPTRGSIRLEKAAEILSRLY
jgi:nicotinamidase-related amidase